MQHSPEAQWNARFKEPEYAYGTDPNVFFKSVLDTLTPARALFVAEGEGRNAVYAALCGWDVTAFDISEEGKKKADKLATEKGAELDYRVGALPDLNFEPESFDLVVLIYSHINPAIRSSYHHILRGLLKTGGTLLVEGFAKKHLEYRAQNPAVGGPPMKEALFSREEFQEDFPDFDWQLAGEMETELHEGIYHRGTAWVLRLVGTKMHSRI